MSDILNRMNEIGKKMQNGTAKERDIMDFHLLFCKQTIVTLNVTGTDDLYALPKEDLVEALDSMGMVMWQDAWKFNPRTKGEASESLVQEEKASKEE